MNTSTTASLTRLERVAQGLVLVGVIGVLGCPLGWFGYGSLNHLHLGSPEWHSHGKFHLMWQGVTYFLLGGLALFGAMRPRRPEFRWLGVGVPWAVFLAYFLVAWSVAPALGVEHPLSHYPPNEWGIRSNVFWISVLLAASAAGLSLSLRCERARGVAERAPQGQA